MRLIGTFRVLHTPEPLVLLSDFSFSFPESNLRRTWLLLTPLRTTCVWYVLFDAIIDESFPARLDSHRPKRKPAAAKHHGSQPDIAGECGAQHRGIYAKDPTLNNTRWISRYKRTCSSSFPLAWTACYRRSSAAAPLVNLSLTALR